MPAIARHRDPLLPRGALTTFRRRCGSRRAGARRATRTRGRR
jgi:hypothetical protein